jgi:hypothetical protein
MLKNELFKSILLSFSFATLVFAFQNCSSPFHSPDAFISNVRPQTINSPSVQTREKTSLQVQ